MEKTLNKIMDKLDSLDQKIDMVDQKVNSLDQKVNSLDQKVNSLDQKVNSLDKKVDSLDQKVNNLDRKVNMMDERLTDEQKRQGDLLHQLINTVAATNVKISETNERMASLETKVDSVVIEVKEIKNSMATKHDLEYYDQMISEHSRQIYKLKNH
ncbi:hypothetical protein PY093_17370 [Cytobacillus sp. S13-E01]|uniref:coiled-coil domain-containing protein n=1 Tax=Cytobacillus sp. S13-E01 TaxID=3031326 RepID=UPI0023D87731|nr:hypothetical protein [Cytobacillus sp. S13-E01]MDF0728412.1 hypothetical protein [Cytobacillus sp. S13-E01]